MLILFYFWALGNAEPSAIDLQRHGFTDANFISFYAVGERILAVGTPVNQVALFEPNGDLVALLDESSAEADVWATPLGLGVTKQEILLISNGREILGFDHDLKPNGAAYPPLTMGTMGGASLGDDRFLLFTFGNESHGLTLVSREQRQWKVGARLFPMEYQEGQPEGQPPAPKFWLSVHQGFAFKWRPLVKGETNYHIDVFDISRGSEEEQVAVLRAELKDIPDFDEYWPALVSAGRLENQFAIGLLLLDSQTFAPVLRRVDLYDAGGAFQERRALPKTLDLKPLQGANRLLALDTESMLLKSYL